MSEKNVYQKLNELKQSVGGFYKDLGKGKGGAGDKLQYNYVSGNQILNAINDKCIDLGLVFMLSGTTSNGYQEYHYRNSKGDEKVDFIVHGNCIFKWVNTDNPNEYIEIPFDYYGAQDDISKSFGSALTYSERYCLLKSLGLPTDDDDPDSKDTSQKYASNSINKASSTNSTTTTQKAENTQNNGSKNKYQLMLELLKNTDKSMNWVNDSLKEHFKLKSNYISYPSLDDETFKKYYEYIKTKLISPKEKTPEFEVNPEDLPF